VDQTKMEIQILEEELPDWIDERHIGVDLLFDENSYREMKFAVDQVKKAAPNSRLESIRDILLGYQKPEFGDMKSLSTDGWPIQHLNPSQKEAITRMMAAKDVFVIHGPPGTGKTTTLVAAVQTALLHIPQVLVCAPSNAAADLLTEKIAATGAKVLRIGNPARISEEILPYTMDYLISNHMEAKEIKRLRKLAYELKRMAYSYKKYYDKREREQKQLMLREAKSILQQIGNMEKYVLDGAKESVKVFVCTLVGAASHFLKNKKFEIVFIDEAGQALEPATWIPILKANKVVLAGDHCQLPPTVKSREASKGGLEVTLLEKVTERGDPSITAMLGIQYRMHEDIMSFSSHYFYGGKLGAHESVKQNLLWKAEGNEPFTFIDTAGTGYEELFHPANTGLSNPEEGRLLIRHLSGWLKESQTLRSNRKKSLTISLISPYREQVEFLKREIQPIEKEEKGRVIFRCGTVDGFQGQEADVVYISLVRSNDRREIGFLRDIRRMNVAITRARMRLVVLGDSSTLSGFGFYDQLLDYMQKKTTYLSAWEFQDN